MVKVLRGAGSRRALLVGAAGVAGLAVTQAVGAQPPAATSDDLDFNYLDLEFTVPAEPQRVVVMEGRGDLEFAVIAGYPVVASANLFWPDEQPGLHLDGFASPDIVLLPIGDNFGPRYEDVLQQRPDLILMRAPGFANDWYGNEQIAAMAPILGVEVNRTSWREDLVAQLAQLRREAHATPFLQRYDDAVAAARETMAARLQGRSVAFITASADNAIPLWTNDFALAVCEDLGLEQPFFDKHDTVGRDLSAEQLVELQDIDLIVRQVNVPEDGAATDSLPTWQLLPAVKAGHVYDISPQFNNGLAITARLLVAEMVQAAQLMTP